MNYHEKFIQMRANLIGHGWFQGRMYSGDINKGPACVMGHIQRVVPYGIQSQAMTNAFMQHAGVTNIPTWNDFPCRTFQEIIAAVDKCIAATAPPPEPVVSITAHDANLVA